MLLVFEMIFSVPVISQIESIGGRWLGGGGMGGVGSWGAEGRLKHQFGLKEQCCAFSK